MSLLHGPLGTTSERVLTWLSFLSENRAEAQPWPIRGAHPRSRNRLGTSANPCYRGRPGSFRPGWPSAPIPGFPEFRTELLRVAGLLSGQAAEVLELARAEIDARAVSDAFGSIRAAPVDPMRTRRPGSSRWMRAAECDRHLA